MSLIVLPQRPPGAADQRHFQPPAQAGRGETHQMEGLKVNVALAFKVGLDTKIVGALLAVLSTPGQQVRG